MKKYKTLIDISGMMGCPVIGKGSIFVETNNGYELEKRYHYNEIGFRYNDKQFVEDNSDIFKEIKE